MSVFIRTVPMLRIAVIALFAVALSLTGLAGAHATTPPAFVSTWDTRNTSAGSSGSTQISLPLRSSGSYNFTVEWGDGSSDTITAYNAPEVTHTYATPGVYTVTITGDINGWAFQESGDRLKITDISAWGPLRLGNDNGYFWGAANLRVTATDALDLTGTTDLGYAFAGARLFNNAAISSWDVSNVTSLASIFENASSFNQPLNSWNTANVEVMRAAFYGATAFNQPLDNWDTSNVWHFGILFTDATSFNQSLGTWAMTSATEVDGMLNGTAMVWSNYNDTLVGWAGQALPALRSGMALGANGRSYTSAAQSARDTLVDVKGWPIDGDQLLASDVPAVSMTGGALPTTQVGNSASTTVTVQNAGTGPLTISDVSVVGLGSPDYTITSNTCELGPIAALATCAVGLTFAPTRDGHRYTFVQIDSNAASSPSLHDVSAFAYGSCSVSPFTSGDGSSGDPYVIMNVDQLNCMNATNSSGQYLYLSSHKYFRLGADIDAGGTTASFQPIGTWWYQFNGDFDGDGHVLSNVVIDDTNAGVFPWLDGGANVHDLTIRDAQVTTLESGGILTAGAWNSTVSNVVIDGGQVEATKGGQVGGLAGFFEGTMSEVTSSATVVSAANANGASVGGLVGQLEGALFRGSSTGAVTVSARASDTVVVGGLLGGTNGAVTDSYTTSPVTVTGGTAGSRVAGFVGDMWGSGTIETSYAAGAVSATTDGDVAGFVGALRDSASVSDTLWNTQTTGQSTDVASAGSTGVTTANMRSIGTYAGWDIAAAPDLTRVWFLRAGFPAELSWTDAASPAVTPTSQTVNSTVGSAMTPTASLSASGFAGSVSYAVSPSLPAGLTLNSATGVVSGTPTTAAATQVFTITATGSLGGEDTVTVSITVSGSSDPAPDPRPGPGSGAAPAPAASGTTSPAAPAPAPAAVPSGLPVSSGSPFVFQQPTAAKPVTGTVTLVPVQVAAGTATRAMRQESSRIISTAPIVTATVNQPVKLLVPGLSPGMRYVVQIRSAKGFVELGSVNANAQGQLQLPVFQKSKPAETTIAIVSPTGKTTYLKVSSTKGDGRKKGNAKSGAKVTSGSDSKPAQGSSTRR